MRCLALLAALALTLGCVPKSLTIQLRPDRGHVQESIVLRDKLGGPKIAQIDLTGVISSAQTSVFGSAALLDDIALMLQRAETDAGVRAVVLRINSPGGSVAASEILANMIEDFKTRTGKPVVTSMGEVAASGGYYTAIATDAIVAQPSTITGSVGVIVPTLNVADGLARIGIKSRSVTSGPNKDIANPLQPMDEAHYAILQGIVDEFYEDFRARVIAARPNIENPDDVLDGSVYTGRRALELGLVDTLGGIREAFDEAKRLADLDSATLVKYHRGGPTPMTPYASVETPSFTQLQTDPALALLGWQNRIRQRGANDPGFYYLWLPPSSLGIE